ncbi:serine/threonine-protein kinase [Nigerium massiliense]|uniref:serine/threonine-protein kinase n=1 Tax=Nigerium massiliense TaxID=1522317 RepID=UPI0006947B04|nr:serine/threonine-protein kinase [Nigerium massiliense]
MYEGALVAGRYRLQARIGSGSMGQVWRALDERLQRTVAVKVIDMSQSNEAVTPERVQREVIATARLNHPNIVTIFDAGTDADLAFLVMELLPGRSLAQLARDEGVLNVDDVIDIALQVSRALEATHAIGVVHRDIKPANIMIAGSNVKILDFGIAQLTSENAATLTSPTTALGTAAYMSPEQALGTRPGPPADIYSLGCVLMALLTGAPPFTGGTSIEVANRQINEQPPLVTDRRPGVRAGVDELIASMLAKSADRRPTARQLTDALLRQRRQSSDATSVLAPGRTAVLPGAGATAVLPDGPGAHAPTRLVSPGEAPGMQPVPGRTNSARRMLAGAGAPVPNGSRRAPGGDPWFGRGLRLIVGVIVTAVVLGLVWVAGSALFRSATSALSPAPGASPSPRTRTTTQAPGPVLPSIQLPTIQAPTLPSVNTAARRAAVLAVDGALRALSPSTPAGQQTKDALISSWSKASDRIVADKNASAELSNFSRQVDRAHERGRISDAEHTAVSVALRGVAGII